MSTICHLEVRGKPGEPQTTGDLPAAIARGTAWAIAPDLLVTAFHVVGQKGIGWSADTAGATYWALDRDGSVEVEPVACDDLADVALLQKVANSTSGRQPWTPLDIADWGVGTGHLWEAGGFAQVANGQLLTLHGAVKAVHSDATSRALELFAEEGGGSSWVGASGSPIVVDGRVVGILTSEISPAATLFGAEIESILRLVRVHLSPDLLNECRRVLGAVTPSEEVGDQPERTPDGARAARERVERAARFGPRGLLELLATLDSDVTLDLGRAIVLRALTPSQERWSPVQPRDGFYQEGKDGAGEVAAGVAGPTPLASAWHQFLQRVPWHERARASLQELAGALRSLGGKSEVIARVASLATAFDSLGRSPTATIDVQRRMLTGYRQARVELRKLLTQSALALRQAPRRPAAEESGEDHAPRDATSRRGRALAELECLVDAPFGRCFLLLGSTGSGKSYFVNAAVRGSGVGLASVLVLPLGNPPQGQPTREAVEALIAEQLRQATGRAFKGLAEFEEALRSVGASQIAFLSSLEPHRRRTGQGVTSETLPRVVVAVDGFERWLPRDPAAAVAACKAFETLVDEHCRGPAIHWLFTLRDGSYDRLSLPTEGPSFWEEYGPVDIAGRSWAEAGEENAPQLPTRAGWISMDDLHRAAETGLRILAAHVGEEAVRRARRRDGEGIPTPAGNYLWQPWFACVLRRLPRAECEVVLNTGDLRYVGLVEAVRKARIAALGGSPAERARTNRYVRILAGLLLQARGRLTWDGQLVVNARRIADDARYVCEESELSVEIDALVLSNLLKKATAENHRVELETALDFLWSYEGARFLSGLLTDRPDRAVADFGRLLGDYGVTGEGELQEGTLEFLLMLLEPDAQNAPRLAGFLLESHYPGAAAAWFAATKMGSEFQRLLLRTHRSSIGSFEWPKLAWRRLLFSWLTFAERASAAVLHANERLELLRPLYEELHREGLSGYYFAVAAQAIDEATDTASVRACMRSLDGCERTRKDLARLLADRAIARLVELNTAAMPEAGQAGLLAERLFGDIEIYLAGSEETVARDHEKLVDARGGEQGTAEKGASARTRWKRLFFREWVLHGYLEKIVGLLEPADAYRFLERKGWYRDTRLPALGLEKTREANIAIGGFFHSRSWALTERNGPGAAFLGLLDDLIRTRSKHGTARRITAFHLIRHTRATYGDLRVKANRAFWPHLSRLWKDEKVRALPAFRALFAETFEGRAPAGSEISE